MNSNGNQLYVFLGRFLGRINRASCCPRTLATCLFKVGHPRIFFDMASGNNFEQEISAKHTRLVNAFESGITRPIEARRQQLRKLYFAIADNEEALKESLVKDLYRSPIETEILELHLIYAEIELAIKNLGKWSADQSVWGDIRVAAARPKLKKSPYGAVLILGPWNYPLLSAVVPLTSAIAAGNTVLLKPTEMAPHSTDLLCSILGKYLDPNVFQSVKGSVPESTYLLSLKWDKIMVTGSCGVGKIVATAAAKNLTPVILELGGKSPVIVTANADLQIAAKRIAWGKFINAGQTCIAPDYVLVDSRVEKQFVQQFIKETTKIYQTMDKNNRDFAHIVNNKLWHRMDDLVKRTKGQIAFQHGSPDEESRFYPPTLVTDVQMDDVLMEEEIFGPILPVIAVDQVVQNASRLVAQNDHPLALYIFTNDEKEADRIVNTTRSGAVLINDTVLHGGSTGVPFGGVGSSGTGRYHGKYGFDEFTHERPILTQPLVLEKFMKARYPPYSFSKLRALRRLGRGNPRFSRQGSLEDSFLKRVLESKLFWAALILGGNAYTLSAHL